MKKTHIVKKNREQVYDIKYRLEFIAIRRCGLIQRRTFLFLKTSKIDENLVCLCKECHSFLTLPKDSDARQLVHVWPSFIWKLFKNEDVFDNYGDYVWRLIPIEWRACWVRTIRIKTNHHDISLDYPPSIVYDKTSSIGKFDSDIASGLLGRLRDTSNKFCHMDVIRRL